MNEPVKDFLTAEELEIHSLKAKLRHERETVSTLLTKLASAEYEINHYKSLLKKALEK
jgi:hypothetical protein